ncbi:hypothetical protein HY637_04415 [Candidatus Woesearchaeota archaeon]|nr:hypothetical protein [Candidatus Woesearchaeota archaeon]
MSYLFSSKKGVSPLIATILLIAFAVALGSVIMNWGLNLNLGKPSDKCGYVALKIRNIDNFDACFGSAGKEGYINFILDNVGTIDVDGLTILIIGEKGTRLFELQKTIKKGTLFDKKDKEVGYDFNMYGNIRQVQFIPKIIDNQETYVCAKNLVEANKIGICSQ